MRAGATRARRLARRSGAACPHRRAAAPPVVGHDAVRRRAGGADRPHPGRGRTGDAAPPRLARVSRARGPPGHHQGRGPRPLRAARRRNRRPLARGGPGRSDVPRTDERRPCRAGDRARHRNPELRLAFAAPAGARWLLPLYELALLAAAALRERGVTEPDIVVATRRARAARGVRPGGERGGPRRARPRRRGTRHERRSRRGVRRRTPAGERRQPRRRRRHRAARTGRTRGSPACRTTRTATSPSTSTATCAGAGRLRRRRRDRLPDQARRPRRPAGRRRRRDDRRTARRDRHAGAVPARAARPAAHRRAHRSTCAPSSARADGASIACSQPRGPPHPTRCGGRPARSPAGT